MDTLSLEVVTALSYSLSSFYNFFGGGGRVVRVSFNMFVYFNLLHAKSIEKELAYSGQNYANMHRRYLNTSR